MVSPLPAAFHCAMAAVTSGTPPLARPCCAPFAMFTCTTGAFQRMGGVFSTNGAAATRASVGDTLSPSGLALPNAAVRTTSPRTVLTAAEAATNPDSGSRLKAVHSLVASSNAMVHLPCHKPAV
jgi:hypothetical protein